jgi:hypothetical protein
MSEASGKLFLRSPSIFKNLRPGTGEICRLPARTILSESFGITDALYAQVQSRLSTNGETLHFGLERAGRYRLLLTENDDWIHVMGLLVRYGASLEAYGFIQHEDGAQLFYALSKTTRFCGSGMLSTATSANAVRNI